MILIDEKRLRGSVIEFEFKHKIAGTPVKVKTTAINLRNATKKAFGAINLEYKELKANKQALRQHAMQS